MPDHDWSVGVHGLGVVGIGLSQCTERPVSVPYIIKKEAVSVSSEDNSICAGLAGEVEGNGSGDGGVERIDLPILRQAHDLITIFAH